jgi:hypothetical protein
LAAAVVENRLHQVSQVKMVDQVVVAQLSVVVQQEQEHRDKAIMVAAVTMTAAAVFKVVAVVGQVPLARLLMVLVAVTAAQELQIHIQVHQSLMLEVEAAVQELVQQVQAVLAAVELEQQVELQQVELQTPAVVVEVHQAQVAQVVQEL